MRGKNYLKFIAGIAALIFILTVLIVANLFLGNPLIAYRAKREAACYIKEKYGHLDLEIEEVTYNPKDGFYFISVASASSIDTHFSLGYRDGVISRDGYESSVLSGMNTADRFCEEYTGSLMPFLAAETSDIAHISVIPEKSALSGFVPDMVFDQTLFGNVEIMIRCTGGTDAGYLSSILQITDKIMKEKGYAAKTFAITGEREGALTELRNIKSEDIESDNLEELLYKAIIQGEYDGITAFSKSLK